MISSADILCIGGAVQDRKFVLAAPLQPGTSNPARSSRSFGGVARNVCENLAHLRLATALMTRVGEDAAGAEMIRHLDALGVDTTLVETDPARATAEYAAVLSGDGRLELGVADMAIFDGLAVLEMLQNPLPGWIFADCNLPAFEINALLGAARQGRFKLALDCVSVAKSARLPLDLTGINLLFANADEASALLNAALPPSRAAEALRARGAAAVVVTLGADGLVLADAECTLHLPAGQVAIVDVTGAGDALIAATLAGLIQGADLRQAAQRGMAAAAATLGSSLSVRADLVQILAERPVI